MPRDFSIKSDSKCLNRSSQGLINLHILQTVFLSYPRFIQILISKLGLLEMRMAVGFKEDNIEAILDIDIVEVGT